MQTYRTLCAVILASAVAAAVLSCGQEADIQVDIPQKKAPSIEDIVPAGAKLTKVTGEFEFDTAGSPCWADGVLYFTNNNFDPAERSKTVKMTAAGEFQVLRENNGVTTTIQKSGRGTFYACEMLGHRVVEMDGDGNIIRVVCDEYEGKRIDGPNDIVVDSRGGLYFTDSQFIGDQQKMQDTPAVYYVKPDGTTIRVIDDVPFPNGVYLSPDEKTLYVANTHGRYLLAYDVAADGTVSNGRNFAELQITEANEETGFSGADGMAVDSAGNIYVVTTQGLGIQVIAPDGTHIGNIPCDVATNNCNFGGADLKTLYVSAKDGIYRIPVKIAGLDLPGK